VTRVGLKKRARRVLTEPIRGASVVAVAYLALLGASVAILSRDPDLNTRTGRHLVAGALGIAALSVVEVLICAIPLRRGERWAHWAAAVPLFLLGIPMFVIDARFAPPHTRVATLLPQGIAVLFGLVLVLLALARYFEKHESKSR
jgi:cytochrome bd-type quinol oxidase subunit 2